jgi:hypothetical protein
MSRLLIVATAAVALAFVVAVVLVMAFGRKK